MVEDGDEYCADDIPPWIDYDAWEMFIQWLRWQGYDAETTLSNFWAALNSYSSMSPEERAFATWTWGEGSGLVSLFPNPHFQLREDLDAWNDLFLIGADVFADGATISGHSLALLGGAALLTPVPEEILTETGALLFLTAAQAADAVALIDMTVTKGINSDDWAWQAGLLGADALSGRVLGTYAIQLTVAATDTGYSLFGDSLSDEYGNGVSFIRWCEKNCPDR
jgi:hypothetical protein